MGADTKANPLGGGALEVGDLVSLRMAASAEAPSAPMALSAILQAMGGMGKVRSACQWALTEKRTHWAWQAHLSDVSAVAEGSNLLSTIAPGTPTPLPSG